LGSYLGQIIYRNSLRIAFDSSPTLSLLTKAQSEPIIQAVEIRKYVKGAVIVGAGTPMNKAIWIVVKGKLRYA
jgi:signal-transduction protein with cAMP-binding, CBS, and nucleotidyltransferase domain